MAYTFFKARGISVGDSLVEEDLLDATLELEQICHGAGVSLHLPEDWIIADSFSNSANTQVIPTDQGIPKGWMGARHRP